MTEEIKEKKISPLKAIRLYCLACCNGSPYEVKNARLKDASFLDSVLVKIQTDQKGF